MTRRYVYHEVLTFVPNSHEKPAELERGKCDVCHEAPADIVENSVKFCARHYAAYKDLKVKP